MLLPVDGPEPSVRDDAESAYRRLNRCFLTTAPARSRKHARGRFSQSIVARKAQRKVGSDARCTVDPATPASLVPLRSSAGNFCDDGIGDPRFRSRFRFITSTAYAVVERPGQASRFPHSVKATPVSRHLPEREYDPFSCANTCAQPVYSSIRCTGTLPEKAVA